MVDRKEDIHYLRGLAARLRSLAITEPYIAARLREIADEADDRADGIEAQHPP